MRYIIQSAYNGYVLEIEYPEKGKQSRRRQTEVYGSLPELCEALKSHEITAKEAENVEN